MKEFEPTISDEVTAVLEEFTHSNDEPPIVTSVDEEHLLINGEAYTIIENYRDAIQLEALNNRYNDILEKYDYIVGDWGFEQLRLKGFYETSDKKTSSEKQIHYLQDYLYEYCNFGCAYFVIKKENVAKAVTKQPRHKKQQHRSKQKAYQDSGLEPVVLPKQKTRAKTKQRNFAVKDTTVAPKELEPHLEKKVVQKDTKRRFEIRQTKK